MIPLLRTRFDRLALPLGLIGVAAVAAYNWRLWQRDKAFLAGRAEPEPLLPLDEWPELPLVSVLVAAWNEAAHIERHVECFLALRYPHKELVLCAGGDDGTLALAGRYAGPQVKVLPQAAGEGKQKALARSLPETRGELIFLTDADCELVDEPFERTLWPVVAEGEQVATGGLRPFAARAEEPFTQCQWSPSYFVETINRGTESLGILGCNASFKREVLEQAWATDEPVATGTDYYLALKVRGNGYFIRRVPESKVATEFPLTLRSYLGRQTRWVKNMALWGFRYEDWYHVRAAVVSMLLGIAMLGLPILLPVLGLPILILYLILWGHILFARIRYVRFLEKGEGLPFSPIQIPMAFVVALVDFLAWTKAAVDVLSEESRDKW